MILDYGQQRYILSYNGELYNAQQLRQELEKLGHTFYSHSDTEVLLHAYAQWKKDVLQRLNGIYAFAVWEEHSGRVFLARDRIGVKPLFYKLHQGGLLFASEIKTLLSYNSVKAQIDAEGIAQLILLGPGRAPGSGVFRDIFELEPGQYAIYEQGKLTIHQYWKLRDREHIHSFDETVEQVRYLVRDAIRRQMVADVPVGAFLSGGLDSSLICAICGREMELSNEKMHTFSVDYANNDRYFVPEKFQPNSDTEYIRLMQSALDCTHHWTVLAPEELVAGIADATVARDLPGMADIDISLLAFCGQIRPYVKVALSGECADEIFGGYPWYRDPAVRDHNGFPWAQNQAQRNSLMHPRWRECMDSEGFVQQWYQKTVAECDILPGTSDTERRMKEMVNLNFRWFMQTLLDRKDRMSMYHGLEVRVPYCDHRIAEYLYGIPWAYKDYRGYEKGLLRHAMQGYLPQSVLYRKKSPYPKTYDPQYLTLVSDLLRQLLAQENAPIFQIVSRTALEQLLYQDYPWPWYGQLMRKPQTIVYMLQLNFWLEHYDVDIL